MKKVLYGALSLVLLLLSFMAVRTATISNRQVCEQPQTIVMDEERAANRLAGAIRFKTVSDLDPAKVDVDAFKALHAHLQDAFPRAHRAMEKEVVGAGSLLYRWKGRNAAFKPILLLSHLDVVPVEPGTEHLWKHAPFSGDISEGYIWGRGTLDFKVSATALLEAAEHLLASNFIPERDIYFAFGEDEEVTGRRGAAQIASLLASRGVQCEFVLDEGACIAENLIPGMKKSVALIGLSEKGYLTLRLTATGTGGHASMPPRETAVGLLSRALTRLEDHPFPLALTPQVREMLTGLAPEMTTGKRFALANLWLTRGLIASALSKSNAMAALLHTTMAPTMLSGSPKENVLATHASALVNVRILPGDTIAGVLAHVQYVLKGDPIRVEALPHATEPSPVSPMDAPAYRTLQKTLAQIFPGTVTVPFTVPSGTDARHYARLSPCIYRFMPIRLDPESLKGIHGANERISARDYANAVRWYIQLLRNAQVAL